MVHDVIKSSLIEKGLSKDSKGKKSMLLKILGNGELSKKLIVHADAFSESAIEAIERCGGEARIKKEI